MIKLTPTRTCLPTRSTAGKIPLFKNYPQSDHKQYIAVLGRIIRLLLAKEETYARDFPLKTTGGATAAKIQKPM